MSEFNDLQKNLAAARKQKSDLKLELLKKTENLHKLREKERMLTRTSDEESRESILASINSERTALQKEIQGSYKNKVTLDAQIGGFLDQLVMLEDPSKTVEKLDDKYPFLLFPLRLETRFRDIAGAKQLWIRVYPDDCNVNAREDLLNESELVNTRNFWIEIWKAGGIEAQEKAAWRALVSSHGSGRSDWLTDNYKPLSVQPIKINPNDIILTVLTESGISLSDPEKDAAAEYWIKYYRAAGDKQKEEEALDDLISVTGQARAAEITEKYRPVNLDHELLAGIGMDDIDVQVAELDLPVEPAGGTAETSWTGAPVARALPDRFAVICFSGSNKRTVLFTKPVADNLAMGPDPSLPDAEQLRQENGELIVNEELKWMVDFEVAINAGMGIKIDLSPTEASLGFDKLLVLGLRLSSDTENSSELLTGLFTDHFHSRDGMGLIRQGTPTNNTEDEKSGFTWLDDPDESYNRIFREEQTFVKTSQHNQKSDGQILSEFLGLGTEVFQKMPNAGGRDHLEAIAMNTALFPSTLGYFMEEMMHPVFSQSDIEATRTFFSNFVSGRGPVPAIRIGQQPYGILPASVFSRLRFSSGTVSDFHATGINEKTRYLTRLHALLGKMEESWDKLLPKVSFTEKTGDPHQILLDILGLHSGSVEFHQRYSQSVQQLYNDVVLRFGISFSTQIVAAIKDRGERLMGELGFDLKIRPKILDKYFLGKPNLLSGPLIDDVPLSEIKTIRPYSVAEENYIEWLIMSDPEQIRKQDFGPDKSAPTALLYLLLRHALLQAISEAGAEMMVNKQLVQDKSVFHDPPFIHVQKEGQGSSKFEHLYSAQPNITGTDNLILAEHLYKTDILTQAHETRNLRSTIDALKELKDTSTAALERLFVEHLDTCNYRLDAWKTGLLNYKLIEQQELRKRAGDGEGENTGLYLGAYGWLHDVRPSAKTLANVNLNEDLDPIFNTNGNPPLQSDSSNLGFIHAPSLNQAATAAILRNAFETNSGEPGTNPFSVNLSSDRVRLANSFLEGIRNGQSLAALLGYQFERGLHDKYSLGKGEIDKFIYPLRKKFPLVADHLESTKVENDHNADFVNPDNKDNIEAMEARNVIDGLKLINHVQTPGKKAYPFGFGTGSNPGDLPVGTAKEMQAINEEIDRILNIHDAISDMVISEEVYQVVQGNFERAAGNAEAFSKGGYPPEIEVVNTPRSGVTLTQRVAVHFDANADPTLSPYDGAGGIATIDLTVRAKAEAPANRWLAGILPDPSRVECKLIYSTPVSEGNEVTITQEDLGLQPLDLLNLFNPGGEQALSALDDRILNYVRYNISNHPKTDLKIEYTKPASPGDKTKYSFFELASLVSSLRKVLTESRYLGQPDIMVPTESGTGEPEYDISNLNDRLDIILLAAEQLRTRLAVLSASAAAEPFDDLVEKTITLFHDAGLLTSEQTGTGFIHQGINGVYNSIFNKVDVLVERWEQKVVDFEDAILLYHAAASDEEKLNHLQKSEGIISTTYTLPMPSLPAFFETIIIDKKANFDSALHELRSLKNSNKGRLEEFMVDSANAVSRVADHDLTFFDTERGRNDLFSEEHMIITLREDILFAIDNLEEQISRGLDDAKGLQDSLDEAETNAAATEQLLLAAKKLLGEDAVIIPRFIMQVEQAAEFRNSHDTSMDLLDYIKSKESRAFPVDDWLYGTARVREKLGQWENISILSESFNPLLSLDLTPIQLPFKVDDRWLAMRFRDEKDLIDDPDNYYLIDSDKLLYTAHFAVAFDIAKPVCGVLLDEWTEVIPEREETTGLAFHYDQPNSEPPQVMLLLVPPEFTGNWKWDDIVDSIEETFEIAKKRAIEPSHLGQTGYGHFLPTTMMAVTLYWITMATNLSINNQIYSKI